jgi:pyridoxamine 5'-phosphate oxidase family protein
MSVFTEVELRYLTGGRRLGRIATVGADGTPHVVPVRWIYNAARDTIDIGGHELERSKKFRDVARTGRAAIVIDDLESTDPWRPRAIEVRGRAEALPLPTPLDPDSPGADHQLGPPTWPQRAYGGEVGPRRSHRPGRRQSLCHDGAQSRHLSGAPAREPPKAASGVSAERG